VTGIKGNVARIDVGYQPAPVSAAARHVVTQIRDLAPPAGTAVLVGGTTAGLVDELASLGATLPWMALLTGVSTFVLLFLAFGSVVLPLKAIVMNVLSLSATFGVVVWIFQWGHLSRLLQFTPTGSIDPTMPILMLAIIFGLSMDYEVFLLSRIRERYDQTGDNTAAVASGLQRTGGLITSLALLLIIVVGAFSASGITFIKLMGVGMIVALLVDATIIRVLLVPATMRLLGRANWWAPRPLRRLHTRIGLAAHDFASALGAPEVLVTRARRDSKSPTVASRFLLRLNAISGGLPRDRALERLTAALDDAGPPHPVARPEPSPPAEQRPDRISVTAVDRLKADPFAFYAQAILRLRAIEPVDDEHTARWKGTAVHQVLQDWQQHDNCDPEKLRPRAERLLSDEAIHPMLRALWAPRLLEAIDWIAEMERANQADGRLPIAAELKGETPLAGVIVEGRVDRIDRLADGTLAIIDYKTGQPPSQKSVAEGFSLQLGLLGLIGRAGGFEGVSGDPEAFEYWSLARYRGKFGRLMCPDKDMDEGEFLAHANRNFAEAARKWLTGNEPFTAKLNPAYAPYGDYDQLMRLEEWYGR